MMVIRTEATLALYCPRCGKLYMHHFTRFNPPGPTRRELLCSCGQVQAVLTGVNRRQYLLDIPCVLCGNGHKVYLDAHRFWQAKADKLYCVEENVELGLFGDRRIIEETFATCKHEFERICEADYENERIDNLHVMFEIFNRVHDLAEQGHIVCNCGNPLIDTEMFPDAIDITCHRCGGRRIILANTEEHLEEVKSWKSIQLTVPRQTWSKQ